MVNTAKLIFDNNNAACPGNWFLHCYWSPGSAIGSFDFNAVRQVVRLSARLLRVFLRTGSFFLNFCSKLGSDKYKIVTSYFFEKNSCFIQNEGNGALWDLKLTLLKFSWNLLITFSIIVPDARHLERHFNVQSYF